jgi:hypothetical protein
VVGVPRLPGRRISRRSGADARPDPGPDAAGPDAAGPDPAGPDPSPDPAGPDAAAPHTGAAGADAAGPHAGAADPVAPLADGTGATPSLGELVARVATPGESDGPADRRRQLGALTRAVGTAARGAGTAARGAGGAARGAGAGARGLGQLLADTLAEAAPRIPVRDARTLRAHHPGRSDDEIADALVVAAGRSTAAFGAAVGALAAVEFAAPPTYLAAPVQLAAETLAVAAVEVKLVAELHEIYGEPAAGTGAQRAAAYLMSWVHQRAVDPKAGAAGLTAVLGYAAKRELRTFLMRRMGRSLTKLAPFLAGAVAGAAVNRRATRGLGDKVVAELRGRHPTVLPG